MRLGSIVLLPALLLAACSSPLVSEDQFSGFLPTYDRLDVVETPSGAKARRWIDPDVSLADYESVFVNPVVFFPPAVATEQVPRETLDAIKALFDEVFVDELSQARRIAAAPGPGTLEITPAISAVTVTSEELQVYEFIPIGLVIAGISEATGMRNQNTRVFVEAVAKDGTTGEPVLMVVRRLQGDVSPDASTQLKAEAFEKVFRSAGADARSLFGPASTNR